jgi:hypothetical protein
LACGGLVQATQTDFYNDGTIQSGDVYDTVDIWDNVTVSMSGGTANVIESRNSSTFIFQSGSLSGWISGFNTSNITMSGGSVVNVQLFSSSTINIMGGNIDGSLGLFGSETIANIYGKNFTSIPNHSGGWTITGNWGDSANSPFSIWYRGNFPLEPGTAGSHIVFYTIPEPATAFLFGFGLMLARKKLRR